MSLSDLAVFNEYAYEAMTEVLQQQIELFNAASNGAIVLRAGAHVGDYSESAHWAKIAGLVRRRNAYGDGAVNPTTLEHLLETSVKVAAGTPPVRIDPSQFKWIQRSPDEAGVVYGRQLAGDTMADMLNTGVMALIAALQGQTEVVSEGLGATAGFTSMNTGASKFGDQAQRIVAWIMHSKVAFDMYGVALANTAGLFTFGNINVRQDGFGRPFIVTDSPALFEDNPGQDYYFSLGVTPGALLIDQNNDFTANIDTDNGYENIRRTIQSEWSYNVGVKGFAWDKNSGGASPDDMALASSANWDRYATSHKDLAGVLLKTR